MASSIWQSMDKSVVGPLLQARLQEADLSQRCRRDRYCVMCARAFCSHCCGGHHAFPGYHIVIPVATDAAGRPTFPARYPATGQPIEGDVVAALLAAGDYATPLPIDAYCVNCSEAFSSRVCSHHHRRDCGPGGFTIRVEERGGRHCFRCRGDEGWLPFLESVLGNPVDEDEGEDGDGELTLLLPLLGIGREPGACVQCGGPNPRLETLSSCCSPACTASHDRDLALRRERRDARRAALQLAKLRIVDGSN